MPAFTSKKCRVVIKKGSHTRLTTLFISPYDMAQIGMNKLHQHVEAQGLSTHARIGLGPMFKLVLETALSASSLEAQANTKEIIIESSKPNVALTKAFHDTSLLSNTLPFTTVCAQFIVSEPPEEIQTLKEAILVKRQISFCGWVCALVATLIVSVVVGVVVGVLVRDADIGIEVASAIAALIACVGAYLIRAYQ